jgi:hypothetical protein
MDGNGSEAGGGADNLSDGGLRHDRGPAHAWGLPPSGRWCPRRRCRLSSNRQQAQSEQGFRRARGEFSLTIKEEHAAEDRPQRARANQPETSGRCAAWRPREACGDYPPLSPRRPASIKTTVTIRTGATGRTICVPGHEPLDVDNGDGKRAARLR